MKADKAADPPPFSSMKPHIRFGVPPVLMRTTWDRLLEKLRAVHGSRAGTSRPS